MNESTRLSTALDVTTETALIGYQVAVNLWMYQGTLNWNRFSIMLAANSVFLTIIGLVLSDQSSSTIRIILRIVLPLLGLWLCRPWLFLMARGEDYRAYWSSRARHFEENNFGGVITTVKESKSKSEGGMIEFSELSKRGGSQQESIYTVIRIFRTLYIIAFAIGFIWSIIILWQVLSGS